MLINNNLAEKIFGVPLSDRQLKDLNSCLERFSINTFPRMTHFISQCAYESNGLRYLQERGEGYYYEMREDLGNTVVGDGKRFRGAGAIKIKGRLMFQAFAEYIKDRQIINGVSVPSFYVETNYPFTSSGFWWESNQMNEYVDQGATCRQVSTKINGFDPADGLIDRLAYYEITRRVLRKND